MKRKITVEFEVTSNHDFESAVLQKKLEQAFIRGSKPVRSFLKSDLENSIGDVIGPQMTEKSKEYKTYMAMGVKVSKPVVKAKQIKENNIMRVHGTATGKERHKATARQIVKAKKHG